MTSREAGHTVTFMCGKPIRSISLNRGDQKTMLLGLLVVEISMIKVKQAQPFPTSELSAGISESVRHRSRLIGQMMLTGTLVELRFLLKGRWLTGPGSAVLSLNGASPHHLIIRLFFENTF